jgi:hypothetical protein
MAGWGKRAANRTVHTKRWQAAARSFPMRRFIKKLFGGSRAPRAACKRPTIKLQVEQLDERLLPSNTGSVSEVFTRNLGNVAFSIGQDKNLYASCNGGYGRRLDNGNCDLQVTAGTDQYGNAVAYVLNSYSSLWALSVNCSNVWNPNNNTFISAETLIANSVVYGPHDWWSSISAAMGRDYYTGDSGGVFYISHNYDYFFQFGHGSQRINTAPVDYEISAGTDQNGYNVVYVLNGVDHNVYERHANSSWSKINVGAVYDGGTMQIAGSINNILYLLQDPLGSDYGYGPYNEHVYGYFGDYAALNSTGIVLKWDGQRLTDVYSVANWHGQEDGAYPQGAYQISAGTDASGNSTIDFLVAAGLTGDQYWMKPTFGDVYQYHASTNQITYPLATYTWAICAGQWGEDFFVDTWGNLVEHDQWNDYWQMGDHVVYY